MISIRTLSAFFAAVALSIATVAARAETWPARPIKVISPFTAGNAGDTVARIVLDRVSQQIGQTLFIENRPGAGGTRRRLCRKERSRRLYTSAQLRIPKFAGHLS